MHSVFALVSLVFATTSLAAPALEQRQGPCVSNLNVLFTLTASHVDRNETIPLGLTNVTSAPPGNSILTVGPPGGISFRLQQSTLTAFEGPEFSGVSIGAVSGNPVTFTRGPPNFPTPEPYCAQLSGPANPYLGVRGDIGNFAICQSVDNLAQVVYRPSANNKAYRFDTCEEVLVRINIPRD